jgi:hypothetical protein
MAYWTMFVIALSAATMWKGAVPPRLLMFAVFLGFALVAITYPRPGLKTWHIAAIVVGIIAQAVFMDSLQW